MADDRGDHNKLDSLGELFEKGFDAIAEIESSNESANGKTFQSLVESAIKNFEGATHLVNQMCLFSDNEEIEEVTTADLKYLLLPAFLGYATAKTVGRDRAEVIQVAEVYFRDFLTRCRQYGVTELENGDKRENPGEGELQQLLCAARQRQQKIQRYQQQKEMLERQKQLKELIKQSRVDAEVVREYYMVLLRYWVNIAIEELRSIEEEKPILEHMTKMKGKPRAPSTSQKPLRPIIITRDKVQKAVYGAGYPSLPTVTVDEFYAKRYPEHAEQDDTPKPWSMQDWSADPEKARREQEEEDAQREALVEADDSEALAYLRSKDDWKDENRRGDGNRKNMG
ncbi:immunoglobulin-binding protein 1-like [Ornithodoros turicata]|uniref:immunoglobulin-binding protein 1-like n=1 Tax=Ornithodoros turicata TaxID=34597 RepID=UPI0031391A4A